MPLTEASNQVQVTHLTSAGHSLVSGLSRFPPQIGNIPGANLLLMQVAAAKRGGSERRSNEGIRLDIFVRYLLSLPMLAPATIYIKQDTSCENLTRCRHPKLVSVKSFRARQAKK